MRPWIELRKRLPNALGIKKRIMKRHLSFIDARWECQLHQPFYAAGHFLSPKFFNLNPNIEDGREVVQGLYECITRLVSDLKTQDKILQELNLYKNAQGLLGMNMAKRQKNALSPSKNIR